MPKHPHKLAKTSRITGVISTTQKGAGYIDHADPKKDSIYLEPGTLHTAMNGDTVEATIIKKNIRGRMTEVGEVVKIVSRAKELFVATIVQALAGAKESEVGFMAVADDKKLYVPISIPADQFSKIKKDDKVYLRMRPWTEPATNPTGDIIRVLGQKGINNVEMESIVLERGFEIGFPAKVEKEADAIEADKKINAEEKTRRRDMSGTLTLTIDPFDAKDFDDAISFKKITGADGKGGEKTFYEIGIHIADVSHYVREGTELDKEAIKRGCSIYLVDRTIPMLPEALSNDVCSLNPHEDKLTFSAIFTLDDKAKVHSRWFGRTLINSTHRFTYEGAQAVIDGKADSPDKTVAEGMKYRDEIMTLDRLAKVMQKQNAAKGAIEFESEEVKFKLDENGKPIGVYPRVHLDTHKLVEEYMLLANREVAKFIFDSMKKKGGKDTGALYRIHDVPDKDKIKDLQAFVKLLGYDLRGKDGEITAHDINHLLGQIEDTPHESLIRTATIRSMQKAVYSTKNVGHFGLAFPFYTHFTSPIRRYPDVLVHRILAKHLNSEPFKDSDIVILQRIAETSTAREIDAAHAERDSKKLKQVEYMSERVGQTFKGTISGVAKWGVYVQETETMCEGIIPISKLGEDYFVFNEKTYSIEGEKTKQKFTLGDAITFKVVSADLDKKQLELSLVS